MCQRRAGASEKNVGVLNVAGLPHFRLLPFPRYHPELVEGSLERFRLHSGAMLRQAQHDKNRRSCRVDFLFGRSVDLLPVSLPSRHRKLRAANSKSVIVRSIACPELVEGFTPRLEVGVNIRVRPGKRITGRFALHFRPVIESSKLGVQCSVFRTLPTPPYSPPLPRIPGSVSRRRLKISSSCFSLRPLFSRATCRTVLPSL